LLNDSGREADIDDSNFTQISMTFLILKIQRMTDGFGRELASQENRISKLNFLKSNSMKVSQADLGLLKLIKSKRHLSLGVSIALILLKLIRIKNVSSSFS